MLFKCPENINQDTINQSARELNSIFESKITKIQRQKSVFKILKEIKNVIFDIFKSFHEFKKILFNNKTQYTYVAFNVSGGMGDILRHRVVIEEIIGLSKNIIIDIYSKKSQLYLQDIENIRFFVDASAIKLLKKKYHVVYKISDHLTDILYMDKQSDNDLVRIIRDNMHEYIKKYPFYFNDMFYTYGKNTIEESNNNNLKYLDALKIKAGLNSVGNYNTSINHGISDLNKFGINENDVFITFQHGCGFRKFSNKLSNKLWSTEYWVKLISILRNNLNKNIKIVQVGVSSYKFDGITDLVGKTSFDDLCSILKRSIMHIDTDAGCVHLAKSLNTKCVVIFGPTSPEFTGYEENINIKSNLCSDCYFIKGWSLGCVRGFKKPLCMESITPEFVAEKAIEYINTVKQN
jgi:ADP-heptose:LPS heptosyltransferase